MKPGITKSLFNKEELPEDDSVYNRILGPKKESSEAPPQTDKAIDDLKKAVVERQATPSTPKSKPSTSSVSTHLADADPANAAKLAGFPMPKGYAPYSFDRKKFADNLETKLGDLEDQYDTKLTELSDKKAAQENSIGMKSVFKNLVDALALLYAAKNAPTASFKTGGHEDQMNAELNRLESYVSQQQNLVKSKFAELRNQVKDQYATAERSAEDIYRRGRDDSKDYQDKLYGAEVNRYRDIRDQERDAASMAAKRASMETKGNVVSGKEDMTRRNKELALTNTYQSALDKLHANGATPEEYITFIEDRGGLPPEKMNEIKAEIKTWFGLGSRGPDAEEVRSRMGAGIASTLARQSVNNIYGPEETPPQSLNEPSSPNSSEDIKYVNDMALWLNNEENKKNPRYYLIQADFENRKAKLNAK